MPRSYVKRTEEDIILREIQAELRSLRGVHLGGVSVARARDLLKRLRKLKEEFQSTPIKSGDGNGGRN